MQTLLDLLLYDWLDAEALCQRPRHKEHSRETFDAALGAAERLAREVFAPLNRTLDMEEPRLIDGKVVQPEGVPHALKAYADLGLLSAGHDHEAGGLQMPYLIDLAANAYFARASISLSAYAMLTYANANLVMTHGTQAQKQAFAQPMTTGRCFGTMCLSEPHAGSSLGDITTRATPDGAGYAQDPLGPRYRVRGSKMWISGGEHELGENILHLVLARSEDEQGAVRPGVKGLSLFVVPRWLVEANGERTGERNDVKLVGLNHKLGYRGTVNTLLAFGDGEFPVRAPGGLNNRGAGAIGYRIGKHGQGLALMFHMMNEARLNVGMGAAMLGMAGYEASLRYARDRTQGRATGAGGKRSDGPQAPLVAHADVRRMLLAQRAYSVGGLALCLYGARLVDEKHTGESASAAEAAILLELLTPVAKSWPSQWCLEANSLAIQIHGGYGYTRDFPVEQFWRDNRLNMIHEGTHGIQALDLLGRKILGDGGVALQCWAARVEATIRRAHGTTELVGAADALADRLALLRHTVRRLQAEPDTARALANAGPFLEAFGHLVLGWIWLDLSLCASVPPVGVEDEQLRQGLRHTARYFFCHELPKFDAWLAPVTALDDTCAEMQDAWF